MARLRSERGKRRIVQEENRFLDNPQEGMALISNLISMPKQKEELQQHVETLNKYVHEEFLEICKLGHLPNEAMMFSSLKKLVQDVEDMCQFSALANKNVVAIGGGFSAGKSQFLNSILQDNILPTELTPTTAIPTYIFKGREEKITALNTFHLSVPLDREAVKAISHEFHERYNVSFSHIIKVLTIEKPSIPYETITFLDTPGYSKSDTFMEKGDNTDERIAREHLMHADYLIWLVDITKGTINDTDIQFLLSLHFTKPLFVIFNKVDLVDEETALQIVQEGKERLADANIPYERVIMYDSTAQEGNERDGNYLRDFFCRVNKRMKFTTVKESFGKVLDEVKKYSFQETKKGKDMLQIMNGFYFEVGDASQEVKDRITFLTNESKEEISRQKGMMKKLDQLEEKLYITLDHVMKLLELKEQTIGDGGVLAYLQGRKADLFDGLSVGDSLKGTVLKRNFFGVFIDFGFNDSAVISMHDIGEAFTNEVEDIFSNGQVVYGEIVTVDRVKKLLVMKMEEKGRSSDEINEGNGAGGEGA
ncbi:dynamin family protein [Evansella sp. AB-P1]|uniref:dynamin family protein n=1 Tax=Evansella sp. AB-P1 TaxID=3037653 RepID=UPI00241C8136|nr:dynamin family protein [Evansella sp. AB-P1]MDG5789329.1 dynamin family protein [Evansella sp. AB-P1]